MPYATYVGLDEAAIRVPPSWTEDAAATNLKWLVVESRVYEILTEQDKKWVQAFNKRVRANQVQFVLERFWGLGPYTYWPRESGNGIPSSEEWVAEIQLSGIRHAGYLQAFVDYAISKHGGCILSVDAYSHEAFMHDWADWALQNRFVPELNDATPEFIAAIPRLMSLKMIQKGCFMDRVVCEVDTRVEDIFDDRFKMQPWWWQAHKYFTCKFGVATCPNHGLGVLFSECVDTAKDCDFNVDGGICRGSYVQVCKPAATLFLTRVEEDKWLRRGWHGAATSHLPSTSVMNCIKATGASLLTPCINSWSDGYGRPNNVILWDAASIFPAAVMARAIALIREAIPRALISLLTIRCSCEVDIVELREAPSRFRPASDHRFPGCTEFRDLPVDAIVAGGFVDSIMRQALGLIAHPCHRDIDVFVSHLYVREIGSGHDAKDGSAAAAATPPDVDNHCSVTTADSVSVDEARADSAKSDTCSIGGRSIRKRAKCHEHACHATGISQVAPVQFISTTNTAVSALLAFFDFTHLQACVCFDACGDPKVLVSPAAVLSWMSSCTVQTAPTTSARIRKHADVKQYGVNVVIRVPESILGDKDDVYYLAEKVLDNNFARHFR